MAFLEEHNYSYDPVKTEATAAIEMPELNIKMECQFLSTDASFDSVEEIEQNEEVQFVNEDVRTTDSKRILKGESDVTSKRNSPTSNSLSDLKKACIFQTCMNLLDSSSSDEDELILLWLLHKNKKKKLRKKQRYV